MRLVATLLSLSALAVVLLGWLAVPPASSDAPGAAPTVPPDVLLRAVYRLPADATTPAVADETLWLARCIYSETKQPAEQELVAWVVRNRVETAYRGQTTYRGVVLDPFQFSAFNRSSPVRAFHLRLAPTDDLPGWRRALHIAHYVRHAPAAARPFPLETRHFFSERSMPGFRHPAWAVPRRLVRIDPKEIDPHRFRFYAEIS
jgi:hypothetical protein